MTVRDRDYQPHNLGLARGEPEWYRVSTPQPYTPTALLTTTAGIPWSLNRSGSESMSFAAVDLVTAR